MARTKKVRQKPKRNTTRKADSVGKTQMETIKHLTEAAAKLSEASKPRPSTTPMPPDQLAAKQLHETEALMNLTQLHQIAQQKLMRQKGGGNSDVRSPTSTEVRSPTSTSTEVRSPTSTSTEVRSPTSTSTEVRSPTSTSTEVRSPTSTSTEVRSPTSTSTDAYTQGNVTVTGGAGAGPTTVYIGIPPEQLRTRADSTANKERSKGSARRMEHMIDETSAARVPAVMPALMDATSASRPKLLMPAIMKATSGPRVPGVMPTMMIATSASRPRVPTKSMMKATSASRRKMPIPGMMKSVSGKSNSATKRRKTRVR